MHRRERNEIQERPTCPYCGEEGAGVRLPAEYSGGVLFECELCDALFGADEATREAVEREREWPYALIA